ncbi:MAG TPA: CBS domain-containing protein [Euryarchaeota archaeon]|nr:hypoxic response protein 1 [archaeon BMS3Bbin15]HDL15860.1 CBS domain-containing protein [Euryarchaeota archaeon]
MKRVEGAMTKYVITVPKDTTLSEAARKMKKFKIGCLVVVENNRPIGIITERDLAYKIVAEERDPGEAINSTMSTDLIFIQKEASLKDAAIKMAGHTIKRLLVGSQDNLEGIISITDVVKVERIGEDPRSYSFT